MSAMTSRPFDAIKPSIRVGLATMKELTSPKNLGVIGLFAIAAIYLGAEEASFATNLPLLDPLNIRYGIENFLPFSAIWSSKPIDLIAQNMHMGQKFMQELTLRLADPSIKEKMINMWGWRSFIVGFFGISEVVNLVNSLRSQGEKYHQRVLKGRETLFTGNGEKRIRLAGSQSDVTEFSFLQKKRNDIIPIIEDPEKMAPFIYLLTKGGKIPRVWQVDSGSYGRKHSWEGFKFSSDWLIRTNTNEKILIIEADASVGEEALALSDEESSNDLDLQEVSQARRSLIDLAEKGKVNPDRTVVVLLANPNQTIMTGGGNKTTLRQEIQELHQADILIDAQAPLILEVLNWLKNVSPTERTIVFDTNNSKYFQTIKEKLGKLGWRVLDRQEKDKYDPEITPRLVYHKTTADTIDKVATLVGIQGIPPSICCALIDRGEGLVELEEINEKLGENKIAHVCSAEIYDRLFEEVYQRLKEGEDPQVIQKSLDVRFQQTLRE
jgi:hypothetical protein